MLVFLVEMNSKFGLKSYESLPKSGYGGFLWNKKPSEEQSKQTLKYLLSRKILHLIICPNPGDW